jgi:RNA polymerase sigma factor (TIGR02999 family)
MRDQRHDSLLQRTALVHEAWLKLFGCEPLEGGSRTEVLALASIAMRNLLVDRARTRSRQKRCSNGRRVSFEQISLAYESRAVDMLALHEALSKLGDFDPEMAQAVELRFFGGLSMEETARCLEVPLRTLERRWEATRFWLRAEIG